MDAIFAKYDPLFESELELAIAEAAKVQDLTFEILFEANQPIQAQTIQNNEQQKTGVVNHLKNALEAIRKMITGLLSNISNWLQKLTMGGKEKALYNKVVEACRNNPELANKQITVTDFRKSKDMYLSMLKQMEAAKAQGNMSEVDRLMNQLKNAAGGALGGVTVTVGMQAAMNIAQSNREVAQMIAQQLQNDTKWLETMEKAVGQKETAKFQKQINMYTKECKIRRGILGIRGQLYSNAAEATMATFKTLEDAIGVATAGGNAERIVKGAKLVGNSQARDMAGRLLGNEQVRGGLKMGAGIIRDTKKQQRAAQKRAKANERFAKAEARRREKGNMTNAMGAEFIGSGVGQLVGSAKDKFNEIIGQ